MLISMTGFGRSVRETSFGTLIAEIQSVNRKMLDIAVWIPKELSRYELDLRKWVSERISRGQVSIRIFLTSSEEVSLPDADSLKRLRKAWLQLAKTAGCDEKEVTLPFLLAHLPPTSSDLGEPEEERLSIVRECVQEALSFLVEMKQHEGEALFFDLDHRLSELELALQGIEAQAQSASAKMREKLQERIRDVLQPGVELEERLLREIALFAEKVDIAEEITRLRSHFAQWKKIIKGVDRAIGRKLEFLLQEMMREINTISSKSGDAAISRLVVDCKSELEKMREQIQNIE